MSSSAESVICASGETLHRGDAVSNPGFANERLQEISLCLSHPTYVLPALYKGKKKSLLLHTEEIAENRATL